ncbi:hypothetical protein Syun_006776 [Stephania yunnanensis]|uniref:Uncharacterized protein n=1 Tax=Stephania yunnanensis TaxID=152371 RepID=A0AAP0PYT8_9MAGN
MRRLSSLDSDLEAFDRNPAHGSFARHLFFSTKRDDQFRLSTPEEGPRKSVPSPSPDSTRWPALAAGAARAILGGQTGSGLGPRARPSSQSFSRSYGSILPTSLAYILPSTGGRSPWRPDAVMSTTGARRYSVLRIFKGAGAPDTTNVRCSSSRRDPTSGEPFPGWAVLNEKITLPEAPADVSDSLTLPSTAASGSGILTRFPFEARAKHAFETGSAPTEARRARALGFTTTAAPSYSSGLDNCPDGGECGLRASAPSISGLVDSANSHPNSGYPEGNFGGNRLLDGSISLSPLYPSRTNDLHVGIGCGPPPSFLGRPRSGIVHHLSGPDGYAHTRTLLKRSRSVGGATR